MGQVHNDKYWLHTWSGVGSSTSTASVRVSGLADKTVTVDGAFDGNTVTIQGSMDDTNFHTMTISGGADATFSAAGMGLLVENPRFIRATTDATGSPSLTIAIGASALK